MGKSAGSCWCIYLNKNDFVVINTCKFYFIYFIRGNDINERDTAVPWPPSITTCISTKKQGESSF